jgi:hypothetical protein
MSLIDVNINNIDLLENNNITKIEFINNYSKNNYIEQTDYIQINDFIGEGSYGKVYKITMNNKIYALKLNNNEIPEKLIQRYNSLISNIYIKNYIIQYHFCGCLLNSKNYKYYSIMDYGGETLKKYIYNENLIKFKYVLKKLYDIINIIATNRLLITDFKLSNIVIDSNKNIKIIDIYMECMNYFPCKKCKIIKTYSCIEIEYDKHIYEDPNYNFSCIYIPFAVCFIDLLCVRQTSHYCHKLSKKFNLNMNIKQLLPLLQIACYNYSNKNNDKLKKYKKIYKLKNKIEEEFNVITDPNFLIYFLDKLKIKSDFRNFISKQKLADIIIDLISIDFNNRSLKEFKSLVW